MFVTKVAVAALSALTVVSAGNSTFSIDVDSVTLATKASWCTSEKNVCGEICSTSENSCEPSTLDFSCVCTDGTEPDMNEYQNSVPYYICETAFANCIAANTDSASGQKNCTTTIADECGTKVAGSSSTTTTAAASSSGTGTAATAASSSVSSSSTSQAGAMPTGIQHLPNGAIAVAAGLLAMAL
ncbi:hypothetical protein PFICI_00336 [Pestalotiopsis fici W106-1]|uniref:DUF7707 domain-containing protein n=1 Tax=Pestalotiopsis fici (strain W106-1 / CGMCC3.15140) TaxID=1229662 RepID=W3XKD4_PESFW|nr:uncharacterized protein PFICI_00336 [Pestalotiopsis fici W106-1]ETS86508.1 hypothetical protein PFICI_00336 [Pestalotiopsis fici W106-1]